MFFYVLVCFLRSQINRFFLIGFGIGRRLPSKNAIKIASIVLLLFITFTTFQFVEILSIRGQDLKRLIQKRLKYENIKPSKHIYAQS